MDDEVLNEMTNRMADNRVVPVVGAGVSVAVAAMPTWSDFLRRALEHLRAGGASDIDPADVERRLSASEFASAAQDLRAALRTASLDAVFLRQSFHRDALPSPLDPLLSAITTLPVPFTLTTNYDRLLEMASRPGTISADWRESTRLLIILNEGGGIIHLHGVYDKPETVVLASGDYHQLGQSDPYAAFLRAVWMQHTLLFVGSSADGIADPDFSLLWEWAASTFPEMPYIHYALVRSGSVPHGARQKLLRECRVQLVEYGDRFEQLPVYLSTLRERATARRDARLRSPALQHVLAATSAPAPVTAPAASRLRPLSEDELKDLIQAFAGVAAMATLDGRNRIRMGLPSEVRYNAPESNVLLLDVTNLVTTSLKYPGGFRSLLRRLRREEGLTFDRQDFDAVIRRIYPELEAELTT